MTCIVNKFNFGICFIDDIKRCLKHEITMNAYYGFCPGGPPGDGGGSWKGLSPGASGDGSGCSTSGNGFSSSFAK